MFVNARGVARFFNHPLLRNNAPPPLELFPTVTHDMYRKMSMTHYVPEETIFDHFSISPKSPYFF